MLLDALLAVMEVGAFVAVFVSALMFAYVTATSYNFVLEFTKRKINDFRNR